MSLCKIEDCLDADVPEFLADCLHPLEQSTTTFWNPLIWLKKKPNQFNSWNLNPAGSINTGPVRPLCQHSITDFLYKSISQLPLYKKKSHNYLSGSGKSSSLWKTIRTPLITFHPPCTLRPKWPNKCAGHRSFPVQGQLSAPPPKAATGAQSGAEQSEPIQQKDSPSPTCFFKRFDASEKWKCAERSDLSAINVTLFLYL